MSLLVTSSPVLLPDLRRSLEYERGLVVMIED